MELKEKIIKAKIQLQNENPFYSYLLLYLKIKEDKENLLNGCLAGVNQRGEMLYSNEMNKLRLDEIKFILCHEVSHLVFNHLDRLGDKEGVVWNIATDLKINDLLVDNNFKLIPNIILTNKEGNLNFQGIEIKDTRKKTAEEIYKELKNKVKEYKGFDKHFKGDKEGEQGEGDKIDWKEKAIEGYTIAKQRGKETQEIGRLLGELHKEKLNWKSLLNAFISQQIPYNETYNKPNKKSYAYGYYMPSIEKEKIQISVCLDVSGSITQKEFDDFFSEIVGIAKAYRERLKIKFYSHDTKAYCNGVIDNGNIDKIKQIKIKGGGGTSHKDLFEMLKKDNTKIAIFFTDLYSDLEEINLNIYPFRKIFISNSDVKIEGLEIWKI